MKAMPSNELTALLTKVSQGEWRVIKDETAAQVKGFPCIETDDYTIVGVEGMYGDIEVDFANAGLMVLSPNLAKEVLRLRIVADAYEEMLATVNGECPSIVNEDNGASSVLINLILDAEQALKEQKESQ